MADTRSFGSRQASLPDARPDRGQQEPAQSACRRNFSQQQQPSNEQRSEQLELRAEQRDVELEGRLQRCLQRERGEGVDAAHQREARRAAVARARNAARAFGLTEDSHKLEDDVEEYEAAAVERALLRRPHDVEQGRHQQRRHHRRDAAQHGARGRGEVPLRRERTERRRASQQLRGRLHVAVGARAVQVAQLSGVRRRGRRREGQGGEQQRRGRRGRWR